MIANVREHLPGATQVVLRDVDGRAAIEALREEAGGFGEIVTGELLRLCDGGEEGFATYAGWFGFEWEGARVEAAFAPSRYEPGIVLISDSGEAARGVARRVRERATRPKGQCAVFGEGRWRAAPEMDAEVVKVYWDDVVLPPETVSGIRGSVERFFRRREAYRGMGVAWRRGILLVGPPGTGKTMVCKAVASANPRVPFLYVRNVDPADAEREIGAVFGRARALAPAILVFEDVDGLVNEANRSIFLNELDGMEDNDGVLVVASSNHPERLDEALLKRPSRFDRVFRIGLPALPERERYAKNLLSRPSLRGRLFPERELGAMARRVAEATGGFTPAHLKEAVLSAALVVAQGDDGEGADASFEELVMAQVDALRSYLRSSRNPKDLAEPDRPDLTIGFRTTTSSS